MIQYKTYLYKEHQLTFSAIELFSFQKIEQCDINEDLIDQLIEWDVAFADEVIIAYENSKLIGCFRYDVGNNPRNIYAAGTFVISEYRNKGLAFSLWEKMIEVKNPIKIYAHAESMGGFNLIEKIKSKYKYKNIEYDLTYSKEVLLLKAG